MYVHKQLKYPHFPYYHDSFCEPASLPFAIILSPPEKETGTGAGVWLQMDVFSTADVTGRGRKGLD